MPKGRGSKVKGRRAKKPAASRSDNPAKRFQEATAALPRHQRKVVDEVLSPGADLRDAGKAMRRKAAAEAGGYTREERRRSRQREEEARRLAARRLAKELNKGSEEG